MATAAKSACDKTGTRKEHEVEAVDVGALGSEGGVVLDGERVLNLSAEADVIERKVLGTSSDLHDSRQVRHGVEEARDPQDGGSLNLLSPFLELGDTLDELRVPLDEVLLRRVRARGPLRRQHVDLKGVLQDFHSIGDVESTVKTRVELCE